VLLAHVCLNIGGKAIAGNTNRFIANNTAQGNNGNFGCSTTNINIPY
jgi:hypothetical protein